MEIVGSIEVEAHLPHFLERVARGEEFTITDDGKPVARLVPVRPDEAGVDVRAAVEAMKQFRKGRTLGGDMTVRALIEEGRRF